MPQCMRAKLLIALLLIPLSTITACDNVEKNPLSMFQGFFQAKDKDFSPHKKIAGSYKLEKMILTDMEINRPYELTVGKYFYSSVTPEMKSFDERFRSYIYFDPKRNWIKIDKNNVCTFVWFMVSPDAPSKDYFRAKKNSPYVMRGKNKVDKCVLANKLIDAPHSFIATESVKYRSEDNWLILEGEVRDLRMSYYYKKL